MKILILILLFVSMISLIGCNTFPKVLKDKSLPLKAESSYVFGWGLLPRPLAHPSGGNTLGAKYIASAPIALNIPDINSKFDKDRAAILSLAGSYKVDFHFMETMGLTEEFIQRGRYSSWGTEFVEVLEDRGDFISLQHTLVMFFYGEGMPTEPMVMKHWRQDWSYEDDVVFSFKGNLTWEREELSPSDVSGSWTQAVFQVDDSPRYEVPGRWEHRGNFSRWTSQSAARPLPRREFSQRSDYIAIEGIHQITLTPTGWVHQQDNLKRANPIEDTELPNYLSTEMGINRYTRIDEPILTGAAGEYFDKAGEYWAFVRSTWEEILQSKDRIVLRKLVEERPQYVAHFEAAVADTSDSETARSIVESYIVE